MSFSHYFRDDYTLNLTSLYKGKRNRFPVSRTVKKNFLKFEGDNRGTNLKVSLPVIKVFRKRNSRSPNTVYSLFLLVCLDVRSGSRSRLDVNQRYIGRGSTDYSVSVGEQTSSPQTWIHETFLGVHETFQHQLQSCLLYYLYFHITYTSKSIFSVDQI